MYSYFEDEFSNSASFIENMTMIQQFGFFMLFSIPLLIFYNKYLYVVDKMNIAIEAKVTDVIDDFFKMKVEYTGYKILNLLIIVLILTTIFDIVNSEYGFTTIESNIIHTIAISLILISVVLFVFITVYFDYFKPTRLLRTSYTWLPSSLFFFLGMISIGILGYKIIKEFGISKEGNGLGTIMIILDQFFGIKITIPNSGLELYLWYVLFIISISFAVRMAYGLTFSLDMWREETPRFLPYAFTIITGFSVVLMYQFIFLDVSYGILNHTVSFMAIAYSIQIVGWIYGFSRMGKTTREEIISDWNDALMAAIEDGKISGNKATKISLLVANNPDSINRDDAIEYLLGMGNKEGIDIGLAVLKDSDNFTRGQVSIAFGKNKCKIATEPLIQLLKDSDEFVRSNAAEGLGFMEDKKAINPLIATLNHDGKIDVRIKAAQALARLGNEIGLGFLLEALKIGDHDVRASVVCVLNVFTNNSAKIALHDSRNDPDPEVKEIADIALSEMGN